MTLNQNRLAIGIHKYQNAERIYHLNRIGRSTRQTVVANADHEIQLDLAGAESIADTPTPPRGAITGSMVGAICGCLAGLGILAVPGIGIVVAVGTTGTTLIMTLVGTGLGVACGGLIDALSGSDVADRVKS